MTVAEKSFQMSLGVTMDQSIPIEVLPNDRLNQVINARVRKAGELSKRYSYITEARTRLDTGTNITTGKRFIQRETELAVTDGHEIFSHVPTLNKWVNRDRIPEAQVLSHRTTLEDPGNLGLHDASVATQGNFACVIGRDLSGSPNFKLYASVYNIVTGALLNSVTIDANTAGIAKVIGIANFFIVVWKDSAGNNIKAKSIDTLASSPAWSGASTLRNDASGLFDVCPAPTGLGFILAYATAAGSLDAYRYNTAFAQQASTTGLRAGKTIVAGIVCLSTNGQSPEIVFIAFGNSTDATVDVIGRNASTLGAGFAAQAVGSVSGGAGAGLSIGFASAASVWLAWSFSGSSATPFDNQCGTSYRRCDNLGTLSASTLTTWNVKVASRIWLYDSHSYMCVYTGLPGETGADTAQKAIAVMDLGNAELTAGDSQIRGRPVARWGEGDIYEGASGFVPSGVWPGPTAGTYLVAHTWQEFEAIGTGRGARVKVTMLNFDDTAAIRWVGQSQIGNDTLIPAGLLHAYDGKRCFEAGFTFYPVIREALPVNGGTLTSGQAYEYVAVFVFTDYAGRRWRSAPSLPVTGTPSGANLTLRLRITHYSLTSMTDSTVNYAFPPGVEVYRRTTTDTTFKRLNISTGPVFPCDPTVQTHITINDNNISTTDQPVLYTEGGVLENVTPPPCRYSCIWDNRVWLGACDDSEVIFFSKELVDGEGVGFDLDQNQRIDDGKGVVALTVQDASLVLLKGDNDGIFHMQGQGPDDTGQNAAYTQPQKIMNSVGCVDSRSVLTGNDGTFFQSRRGIESLGRQLGTGIFGKNVQDLLDAAGFVTSVRFEPDAGEYRFTAPISNLGQILVYTQDTACWSVDFLYDAATSNGDQKILDATVLSGTYYMLSSTGYVWREVVGGYDGDTKDGTDVWNGSGFITGDIALAGPLGQISHFNVALLGRKAGNHGISIIGLLDQGATAAFNKTFTEAEVNAFKWIPVEVPQVNSTVQQGRSLRLRVLDTANSGEVGTAGAVWLHLLIEYGIEQRKLPVPVVNRK